MGHPETLIYNTVHIYIYLFMCFCTVYACRGLWPKSDTIKNLNLKSISVNRFYLCPKLQYTNVWIVLYSIEHICRAHTRSKFPINCRQLLIQLAINSTARIIFLMFVCRKKWSSNQLFEDKVIWLANIIARCGMFTVQVRVVIDIRLKCDVKEANT